MEAYLDEAFPSLAIEGIDMPEDSKPIGGISSDLFFKLLPYIILAVTYAVSFGRKDNNVDIVVQQLAEQRAQVSNMNDKLSTISDRLSRLEGSQESLRRDLDQERQSRH